MPHPGPFGGRACHKQLFDQRSPRFVPGDSELLVKVKAVGPRAENWAMSVPGWEAACAQTKGVKDYGLQGKVTHPVVRALGGISSLRF